METKKSSDDVKFKAAASTLFCHLAVQVAAEIRKCDTVIDFQFSHGTDNVHLRDLERILKACRTISQDPKVWNKRHAAKLAEKKAYVANIRVRIPGYFNITYYAELRDTESIIGYSGSQNFSQIEIENYLSGTME